MICIVTVAALLSTWQKQVILPLRPISIQATSDLDLEPIRKAIVGARIIQLGELTHGDGTTFALKCRIVKFLHERAGFEILVWESGLLDCDQLDMSLKSGAPITEVTGRAIFSHWAHAKECQMIFDYARSSWASKNPLRMAGFDIQSSGKGGNQIFLDFLVSVLDIEADQNLRDEVAKVQMMPVSEAKDDAILALAQPLQGYLSFVGPKIAAIKGDKQYSEIQQKANSFLKYFEMMQSYRRFQNSHTGEEFQVGYNLREKANYENLLWLADSKFRGKKLIVWGHNSHISNLGADGNYHTPAEHEVVLESTGRLLKHKYNRKIYSLGFVASGGSWSWLGQTPKSMEPARSGSVEELLSRSGYDYGFLDLANARKRPSILNRPIGGYMSRQSGQFSNLIWPKVFDGLIYVREMKPRTELRK